MAARDETPTGRMQNGFKGLESMPAFPQLRRLPLPPSALVAEMHASFLASGIGPLDTVASMRQFEGVRIGPAG